MKILKLRFAFCLVLLLALLPACGRPASRPVIHLQPCTGYWHYSQVLCGTLRVYEDRESRSGRMIDLKVVVVKASDPHPAPDPVFYLAGGPGGAAASEDARNQQFPYELSDNHDLVFVDQRGTGESNQVLTPANPPDLSNMTPEEMDPVIKKWIADYLAKTDMDPRYYTTSVAMDDLDDVRQALGYDKINLMGCSYGATAAQYYLRQHEDHVRTITLCVGSLLDVPVFERWAQNTQQALNNVFDLCAAQTSCRAAFPDLQAEFKSLMERLAAQPEVVSFPDRLTGQPGTLMFDVDFFSGTLRAMMKDASNDPLVPVFIHRAAVDNNWDGFVNYIYGGGGPEWWGNQMMDHVIRCSEKWSIFDPARVEQLSQGSFMSVRDIALAQNTAFTCRYTPAGFTPEGFSPQKGSDVPVLAINGSLDPIDPPSNMTGMSTLFPNSLALTLPYQGHRQSNSTAIYCYFSIENEFIQSGSVQGLDTGCLQNIKPPVFVAPVSQQ